MGEDKYADWTRLSVEELTAFFGFMILMGLVKLSDYWSKDNTFHYGPMVDRIMTDRFLDIMRYLHFADNSTLPKPGISDHSKLGKIQPVINLLSGQFKELYNRISL